MVRRPAGWPGRSARRTPWVAALLAGGLALAGCTEDASGPEPRRYAIEADGGGGQYGTADAMLADPLRVRVTDAATGEPIEGLPVVWRVTEGAGARIRARTATDSTGIARAELHLGADTGAYRALASTNGLAGPHATFEARAVLAPRIASIRPDTVDAGEIVTITGENFGADGAGPAVSFGGIRGEVVGVGPTELRARVPTCIPTGAVDVAVHLGAVTGASAPVAVTGDGAEPLRMDVGAARRFDRDELDCLRLPGDGSGAAFLAVLQNATATADRAMPYQLAGVAGTDESGVADARVGRAATPAVDLRIDAPGLAWELRRRRREARISPADLLNRSSEGGAHPDAAEVPDVGDEKTFRVYNQDETFDTVTARVEHISRHAVIYQDVEAPAGGFTAQDFESFGALFDDPIHDTVVSAYGEPSDVDGNGRIIILFTPVVNELTDVGSDGFIAGFFYGLDLSDGAGSNEAEIFYSLVPDPDGEFGDVRSKQDVLRTVPPVLAHELQHMVHFNQRHIARGADAGEALWLSEALAHMAEDLVADSLLARGDTVRGRDFKSANALRAYNYLRTPTATSLISENRPGTLELRGAAWLFLEYLRGHFGTTHANCPDSLLCRLTQTTRTGTDNVAAVTESAWEVLFHRWSAALWVDGAPELAGESVDPALTFANMELRSEIARWLDRSFPLAPAVEPFRDLVRQGSLPASSADYVIFEAEGAEPPLHLNLAGRRGGVLEANVTPQVGLIRIR